MTVKALTVQQPWAWAIAAGAKTVENPVPCPGQLGLWTLPADVEAQIPAATGGPW